MSVQAEQHIYASVRPASLADLPALVARLEPAADWCGYQLALYGSTLRNGQGRDFDFVLFPTRVCPRVSPAEEVRDRLVQAGMVVLAFEDGGLFRRCGIVGTLDGLAIDLTVLEGLA